MAGLENSPAACRTRSCLEANEGRVVELEGTYRFPEKRAFAVNRLLLEDGCVITLVPPAGELRESLVEANDGMAMRLRGRIFTGIIPEKYRIIGRTDEPHLLEIERIVIDDCQ